MTFPGLNTETFSSLFRKANLNKEVFILDQKQKEQFSLKNSNVSDEKISKLVNSANLESSKEAAAIRPQYMRGTPVSQTEKSSKAYLNSVTFSDGNAFIEEADYYVENENGFPEGYKFPKNQFEPTGYFLTTPKEHLKSMPSNYGLTDAEILKQKFYVAETKIGSLINVTL